MVLPSDKEKYKSTRNENYRLRFENRKLKKENKELKEENERLTRYRDKAAKEIAYWRPLALERQDDGDPGDRLPGRCSESAWPTCKDGKTYEECKECFEQATQGTVNAAKEFCCPECGSNYWGTSGMTGPFEEWIGCCHGQGCEFTWKRTEDHKVMLLVSRRRSHETL